MISASAIITLQYERSCSLECTKNGKQLAAESFDGDDERRLFVGACSLDLSAKMSREFLCNHGVEVFRESSTAYDVRGFAVDRKLIQDDVWIGEPELQDKVSRVVFSESVPSFAHKSAVSNNLSGSGSRMTIANSFTSEPLDI